MRRSRRRSAPPCPRCGSDETVPIAYGLPGPELMEDAQRGEVVLGGCTVFDGQPTMACTECEHRF